MAAFFRDKSERKQAEEAVRRNEILLRNVLDALPVGVTITDDKGKVLLTNPASDQIWGLRRLDDISQLDRFRRWRTGTGEEITGDEWGLAQAVKMGEPSGKQMVYIEGVGGKRKTILNSGVPIRDERGQMIGAIGVNQDVSELKEAEDRLRRSEEHFRLLIENSSDMITTIDQNQNITYISPSVERNLGYLPDYVRGKRVSEFIHPDDWRDTSKAFAGILQATGVTRSVEHRLRHRDGTWRIHQTVGRSLFDDPARP